MITRPVNRRYTDEEIVHEMRATSYKVGKLLGRDMELHTIADVMALPLPAEYAMFLSEGGIDYLAFTGSLHKLDTKLEYVEYGWNDMAITGYETEETVQLKVRSKPIVNVMSMYSPAHALASVWYVFTSGEYKQLSEVAGDE